MLLASAFAQTLQCEKGGVEPCGTCHSCVQAQSLNQPDIIRVTHEKPNSIGVDDIRDQLCSDILIRPYSSPWKIYIVDEAEKMTVQAQNALLKTIEEPPAYGMVLLLTENSQSFLPTILSRCVTLKLRPVKDEQIRKYLMEELRCRITRQTCALPSPEAMWERARGWPSRSISQSFGTR